MKNRKIIALFTTIVFIIVLFCSLGFLVMEADHHCNHHNHCKTCKQIQVCQSFIQQVTLLLVGLCYLVGVLVYSQKKLANTIFWLIKNTLLNQGVKLTI